MGKKLFVILMTIFLAVSLSGCGKGSSETDQTASSKDYVYRLTPMELDSYSSLIKNGDYIYACGYQYQDDGTSVISLALLDTEGKIKEEGKCLAGENENLYSFSCDDQGGIYAVKDIYAQEPDEEGNYIDQYYLIKLSSSGEELFCVFLNEIPQVKELAGDGWLYTGDTVCCQDKVYVKVMENYLSFDRDGNFLKMLPSEGEDSLQGATLYPIAGGKVAALKNEDDGAYLGYADMESGTIKNKTKLPGAASFDFTIYSGNEKYELLLVNSYGVYGYNISDTAYTQLMNYIDSDLGSYGLYNLVSINDREFLAAYDDQENYKTSIGRFTKVDPKDIKDKTVMTLACAGLDWDVRNRVVEFNKSSETYRITIQDYSVLYNSVDDYEAGITRLNTDIASGKVPDIVIVNDSMPVESYISKGLFEDLKPYIEEDDELDIDNYMPNVIDAYSVDGKLYRLVPYYTINTMVAKTSEVGEERGWTVRDINELMETKPEDTMFLNYIDRDTMLRCCMNSAGNQYVDWESGACSFDTDGFTQMLTFLKQFPKEIDDTMYTDRYWENYDSMWREGKVVAMMYNVSGFRDYQYTQQGTFGEPITMIGFPSENGDGSAIMSYLQMAMSAKSSNKEGVWQFLRYYLTDEYQDTVSYGLPLSIKRLDALGEEAMKKPTYIDENGNEVESQDYYYLNGVEIPINPMTKEEVENFKKTLYSFNQVYNYDENLIQIIEEEAAAFFNGQKSEKDVAAIIQSRVKIYVNENR